MNTVPLASNYGTTQFHTNMYSHYGSVVPDHHSKTISQAANGNGLPFSEPFLSLSAAHTPNVFNGQISTASPIPLPSSDMHGLLNLNQGRVPPAHSKPRPTFGSRNIHLNISFDGSPNGLPIERFLFRVERLAMSNGIPIEYLVDELHFLVRGQASEYYWSVLEQNRGHITWDQMKTAMRERYRDPRTDFDIRRAIDCRRQKRNEPFIEFYSEILDMAIPLRNRLSDDDILMILIRNMSNELQYKLAGLNFLTVNELVNQCVSIEDTWIRLNKQSNLSTSYKRVEEISDSTLVCPSLTNPVDNIVPQLRNLQFNPVNEPHRLNDDEGQLNSLKFPRNFHERRIFVEKGTLACWTVVQALAFWV